MENINNKVNQKFIDLFNEGYYLRPQKFSNCIVVQLTKDLNPINCSAHRKTAMEVNINTAKKLAKIWGFKIKNEVSYFGKSEPVQKGMKREFFYN